MLKQRWPNPILKKIQDTNPPKPSKTLQSPPRSPNIPKSSKPPPPPTLAPKDPLNHLAPHRSARASRAASAVESRSAPSQSPRCCANSGRSLIRRGVAFFAHFVGVFVRCLLQLSLATHEILLRAGCAGSVAQWQRALGLWLREVMGSNPIGIRLQLVVHHAAL